MAVVVGRVDSPSLAFHVTKEFFLIKKSTFLRATKVFYHSTSFTAYLISTCPHLDHDKEALLPCLCLEEVDSSLGHLRDGWLVLCLGHVVPHHVGVGENAYKIRDGLFLSFQLQFFVTQLEQFFNDMCSPITWSLSVRSSASKSSFVSMYFLFPWLVLFSHSASKSLSSSL